MNCAPVWRPLDRRVASVPRTERRGNARRDNNRRRQGQYGHRKAPSNRRDRAAPRGPEDFRRSSNPRGMVVHGKAGHFHAFHAPYATAAAVVASLLR